MPGYKEDLESTDEEIANLENMIRNPELFGETRDDEDEGDDLSEAREKNLEFRRRKAKFREWDKPKLSKINFQKFSKWLNALIFIFFCLFYDF